MSREQNDTTGKFTRSVTKNDIAPKDGSPPMEVVEFSLTNETRDALKEALGKLIEDRKGYHHSKLAKIIEAYMPKEIMEEMRDFSKAKDDPHHVYVIRNLPENANDYPHAPLDSERIKPSKPGGTELPTSYRDWAFRNNYTQLISFGLAKSMKYRKKDMIAFVRTPGGSVVGDQLHKHRVPITALGVAYTNGAPTRLVDMQALIEDEEASNVTIEYKRLKKIFGKKEGTTKLSKLPEALEQWNKADELSIHGAEWRSAIALEGLTDKHGQDITLNAGDILFVPEDGRIYHQARVGPVSKEVIHVSRIVNGVTAHRPR